MNKTLILILALLPFWTSYSSETENALGLINDRISTEVQQSTKSTEYSYDCLISDPMAMMAFYSHKGEVTAVEMAPGGVSAIQENKLGDSLCEYQQKEKKFITSGPKLEALENMLAKLLRARPKGHRGLKYTIHLVEEEIVNATTFGGHIYIYTGIIDFCETESELSCIIAHEIGHNEHGHMNRDLKRRKIAGNFASVISTLKDITTKSFNQFNELECDLYGADVAYAAGYNPKAGAEFWKKMAEASKSQNNLFGKLFRTHPYSADRYNCLTKYIQNNYDL